jgi:NAD(P)-dependent dehydrogenase (short-subunit alcohol dehydrogenase family)
VSAAVVGIGLALEESVLLERVEEGDGVSWVQVLTHLAGQIPTRRLSTEADVARMVAFLASPANGNTTGAEIPVTGGLHL